MGSSIPVSVNHSSSICPPPQAGILVSKVQGEFLLLVCPQLNSEMAGGQARGLPASQGTAAGGAYKYLRELRDANPMEQRK